MLLHIFGERYELPIQLPFFLAGAGLVVFFSFLLILPKVDHSSWTTTPREGGAPLEQRRWLAAISLVALTLAVFGGFIGSQEAAENSLILLMWIFGWVAVPISCALVGDWTRQVNPFMAIAKLTDHDGLRKLVLNRRRLSWPESWGWWPASLFYILAVAGELLYQPVSIHPQSLAFVLAVYAVLTAMGGLIFGAESWCKYAELWSVLYSTWGRLGWWRFGADGKRGFAGGLQVGFSPTASRITFVLLLLVSVSFDGFLATGAWASIRASLAGNLGLGSGAFNLITLLMLFLFLGLGWAFLYGFTAAVRRVGGIEGSILDIASGLLRSLLPISFGYLLAHNLFNVLVNGQLLIPQLGNPWGLHGVALLPPPFTDAYVVNHQPIPSWTVWYFDVAVVVAVHIVAVVLAHRYLQRRAASLTAARRSEWPWIVAMVGYTMTSLWLLAQPIVQAASAG